MSELSEHTVGRLLAKPAVVRGTVTWNARAPRVRTRLAVDNELGEPLELEMHISRRRPWHYSIVLLWAKRPVKRLDARGSHTNVCDGSRRRWRSQTHKHAYTDRYELAQAYDPHDIPPTPRKGLQPDEHRRVFEAFCQECDIECDFEWRDPPPGQNQLTTMEGTA